MTSASRPLFSAPPLLAEQPSPKPKFKDLKPGRRPISPTLHRQILAIEPRAVLALAAAMSEWALWRVDGHHESSTQDLLETLWAVAVHPSYLRAFQLGAIPDGSDPRWKTPAQGAYWRVSMLHRSLVEEMLGYQHLHELHAWCQQILETKERKEAYLSWLASIGEKLEQAYPIDATSKEVLTQQRPSEAKQQALQWGKILTRADFFEGVPAAKDPRSATDAFLRALDPEKNPQLCPRDKLATNRCWRATLPAIPGWTAPPYTAPEG